MILHVIIKKEDKPDEDGIFWWMAHIQEFDYITQGETLPNAIDMCIDLVRCVADKPELRVEYAVLRQIGNDLAFVELYVEPNEELEEQYNNLRS